MLLRNETEERAPYEYVSKISPWDSYYIDFYRSVRISKRDWFTIKSISVARVITNLISNTLRYNQAGTVLYVSCEQKEGNVILWIGDNGIGVSEQIKEYIFE
ncbi:sensor histidine kinase [Paenibacillus sp. 481]|uniref:sensor histidine kinase n=1 Tax=Paenibacillus sp. 481 TaxID=2835869 RepID=UPI002FC3C63B